MYSRGVVSHNPLHACLVDGQLGASVRNCVFERLLLHKGRQRLKERGAPHEGAYCVVHGRRDDRVFASTEFMLNTFSEPDPVTDCACCWRMPSDSRVGVADTTLLLFNAAVLEVERAGESCCTPRKTAPFETV